VSATGQEASCPARATAAAKALVAQLDYRGAAAATAGVERCFDGTAAEVAEALRWRGQANGAAGEYAVAIEAFALAGMIAPADELEPFGSPGSVLGQRLHKLQRAGLEKARLEQRVFSRLLAPTVEEGWWQLRVEVYDALNRSLTVTFHFESGKSALDLTGRREGDRLVTEVPVTSRGTVEALVRDEAGATVARSGQLELPAAAADVPRAARLTPDRKPAAAEPCVSAERPSRTPLFLVVGSVAVVTAVAIGLTVALVANQPPEVTGSLGRLELPGR
jgi:hypothetical protein